MVRRIRNISELKNSGFGQPWPRHGLKLLYWFASECISDARNDDMILLCDPSTAEFGFHFFENRCYRRNAKLLPDVMSPYYVLGNLNSPGAEMLPDYVVEDNTHSREDDSNADRIIVCFLGENQFGKVYVTTHVNLSSYDPQATFHITRTLLCIIRSYHSIDDFLRDTGYQILIQTEVTVSPVWYYDPEQLLWVARLEQPVCPLPLQYNVSETHIDIEPASTVYSADVSVHVENDTETQRHTENSPGRKRLWERFCTIL